jgi:hypothetical protein
VELEARPPLRETERRALTVALARAGIRLDAAPEAYTSPWRRQAAREAAGVGRELPPPRYARSPRSTRGAMRA